MNTPRVTATCTNALTLLFVMGLLACESGAGSTAQTSPDGRATVTSAAPAITPELPSSGPRVVFLGDSITAGLNLPAEQAFPARVQALLAASGTPFDLVNAGVSGDTSAGGLRRIDWLLKQHPDVVVVELGGNDGLRGAQVSEIEANLRALLTKIKASGSDVLLLGVQIPTSYGAEYAEAVRALYPRLARELSVSFVPDFMAGVGGVPELNLADGLHPTPEGHERLARTVAPALRERLARHHAQAD